jgi:hypothetical protein
LWIHFELTVEKENENENNIQNFLGIEFRVQVISKFRLMSFDVLHYKIPRPAQICVKGNCMRRSPIHRAEVVARHPNGRWIGVTGLCKNGDEWYGSTWWVEVDHYGWCPSRDVGW